ncbi:MAG: hypothetical protein MUF54_01280 [Polyangiaceae bacterium]|nr:hypothetical protein [Polyangiaceae bacterium]
MTTTRDAFPANALRLIATASALSMLGCSQAAPPPNLPPPEYEAPRAMPGSAQPADGGSLHPPPLSPSMLESPDPALADDSGVNGGAQERADAQPRPVPQR